MSFVAQDLITDARVLADMERSGFVADPTFLTWANDAQRELNQVVSESFGEAWFAIANDQTIVNGGTLNGFSFDTSSGTAFRKVLGITKDPGTPMRRSLRRYNVGQRDGDRSELRYRQTGTGIAIEPHETNAGIYRVYFQYAPADFVTTGSVIDPVLDQWKSYMSTTMAIKALTKAERSTATLQRRIDRMRLQIQQMASTRDVGEAGAISDVVTENRRSRLWRR